MKLRTTYITFLGTLLILLFSSLKSRAAHTMGGELTTVCLGGGQYQVTFSGYVSCNRSLGTTVQLQVYNQPANTLFGNFTLNFTVRNNVPVVNNPCAINPNPPCIAQEQFSAIINLPPTPGGYLLATSSCCRIGTITNLVNPGSHNTVITTNIAGTNATTTCNDNPTFNQFPPASICLNLPMNIDYSATDPDGDQLVYSFTNALGNTATPNGPPFNPVNWAGGFTALNPLNSGLAINPATGMITGVPQNLGLFTVGVQVQEFRAGVLLTTTIRDFVFNVTACNANVFNMFENGVPTNLSNVCNTDTAFITVDPNANLTNIVWNDGVVGPNRQFLPPSANYSAVAIDGQGCPTLGNINVTFGSLSLNIGLDDSICEGDLYTATAVTDDATAIITWQDLSTGPTYSTNTAETIIASAANNFCTTNDTLELSLFTLRPLNLGNDTTLCQGATLLLNPSGLNSVSKLWSDGSSNDSYLVNSPGTYWLQITNDNNCTEVDSIVVTYESRQNLIVEDSAFLCRADSLPISLNGQATYSWPELNSTDSNVVLRNDGTYNLNWTSHLGCSYNDTIKIKVDDNVFEIGNDSIVCEGTTHLIDLTGRGLTFLWDDGSTNATRIVDHEGYYVASISNLNGCPEVDSLFVNYDSLSVSVQNDTAFCAGQSKTIVTNVTRNMGNVTYLWSPNGETSSDIIVNSSGEYIVVVNDDYCSASDSIHITVNPNPVVDIQPDTSICQGDSYLLDAQNIGSTYLWNTNEVTQTILVNTAGSYTVEVTNGFGCKDTSSMDLGIDPLPVINIGPDVSICDYESHTFDAANVANPTVTYLWSTNETTNSITPTSSGTYSVVATSDKNCLDADTAVLTINVSPIVDLGADQVICSIDSILLDADNTGNTVLWNPGGETTQIITANTTGQYSVEVTTPENCVNSDTMILTVIEMPVVDLGADQRICQGQSVQLDAQNPTSTYYWSDGSTNQTLNVTTAGSYIVTVTEAGLCISKDTFQLFVNPIPIADAGSDQIACVNLTPATLTGGPSGDYDYLWNTGETSQSIEVTIEGTYTLSVSDSIGCTGSDDVEVVELIAPSQNILDMPVECEWQYLNYDASHDQSKYVWSTGDDTPNLHITDTGKYHVTKTNFCGTATDSISLYYNRKCDCQVHAPTAFTPADQNGINDEFEIKFDCEFINYELRIYNRWGQLVFFSNTYGETWNGKDQNNQSNTLAQTDVYVWVLNYESYFDHKRGARKDHGHVTLIK